MGKCLAAACNWWDRCALIREQPLAAHAITTLPVWPGDLPAPVPSVHSWGFYVHPFHCGDLIILLWTCGLRKSLSRWFSWNPQTRSVHMTIRRKIAGLGFFLLGALITAIILLDRCDLTHYSHYIKLHVYTHPIGSAQRTLHTQTWAHNAITSVGLTENVFNPAPDNLENRELLQYLLNIEVQELLIQRWRHLHLSLMDPVPRRQITMKVQYLGYVHT